MSFTVTQTKRSEERDGVTWVWVDSSSWVSAHSELLAQGGVRFEWMTATHLLGEQFDVVSRIANEDLSESIVLVTRIENAQLDSVVDVYVVADFHEREITQMFGISFSGRMTTELAFDTEFGGHPLRRDFALASRIDRAWPGAVEPDENAKRRPALPPGVFTEWQS